MERCKNGFCLQEFEIVYPPLEDIIKYVSSNFQLGIESDVPIIELLKTDSTIEFGFTTANRRNVCESYIYRFNKRIVGYYKYEDANYILLSNVSDKYDFENTFYEYLIPTEKSRKFDYIYFPQNMYILTDRANRIPAPPELFDPYYYWYVVNDGEFIFQSDYTEGKYECY